MSIQKKLNANKQRRREVQSQLVRVREHIYQQFRSATKLKNKLPEPSVTTRLRGGWTDYTGYCADISLGRQLLADEERLAADLAQLQQEADELLAPRRLARAERRYQAALAKYHIDVAVWQEQ